MGGIAGAGAGKADASPFSSFSSSASCTFLALLASFLFWVFVILGLEGQGCKRGGGRIRRVRRIGKPAMGYISLASIPLLHLPPTCRPASEL